MATTQNAVDENMQQSASAPSTGATPAPEPSSLKGVFPLVKLPFPAFFFVLQLANKVLAKQVKMSDLLALRGIPPPPPQPFVSLQQSRLDQIQAVFLAMYAPGIDKFLETRWFQEKALPHLLANVQLMAQYSGLIDAFDEPNVNDPAVSSRIESFEASVIWDTIRLCRSTNLSNGNAPSTQDLDLLTAVKRLEVFEALVTGEHLEANPLAPFSVQEPAAKPLTLPDQLQKRLSDFWDSIGHFLTLHDDEASSAKEIDDTLVRARMLLDTCENRDVIYSIAITRHIGQRSADFPHSVPQPTTTDEKDPGAKLYVAQRFLEQQASGKGTTQVIKRICGMVVRSWTVSRQ